MIYPQRAASVVSVPALMLVTVLFAVPVNGQSSRAGVIEEQQREKARTAAPYVPSRAETILQQIEQGRFPFLGTADGFYPAFGSAYPGGGAAFGGGYRRFVTDRSRIDVHGLVSVKTYKRVEATYHGPIDARNRLSFATRVGWLDAPRIGFFGLGTESIRDDHTVFGLEERYAEGRLIWKPVRWVEVAGGAGYDAFDEKSGTGRIQSIEQRFSGAATPHIGEDPTYTKLSTSAALLWLDTPAYSRHGGYLRGSYDAYLRQERPATFGLTRTEIVQHIPILRETWVISLRARRDAVVGDVEEAPYFLVPSLGSGSTLRAYMTDRFRGRQTLLLQGEWRWIPSRLALDLALFVDAGQVGETWSALRDSPFRKDYGIGVRFHTPAATALRIEVARGDEGLHLVFAASAPF